MQIMGIMNQLRLIETIVVFESSCHAADKPATPRLIETIVVFEFATCSNGGFTDGRLIETIVVFE